MSNFRFCDQNRVVLGQKLVLYNEFLRFHKHIIVSSKIEAKIAFSEFFRTSLFELNFLPAGMHTPWSILVYPVQNLLPQWVVEVLTKVTNEFT